MVVRDPPVLRRRRLKSWLGAPLELPGRVLIGLARLYQGMGRPWVGRTCRFEPSCSEYFILAVRKYGAIGGLWRGVWRICRCHPFHPGGYDPP